MIYDHGCEWIEWSEAELDAVPVEEWTLYCGGTHYIMQTPERFTPRATGIAARLREIEQINSHKESHRHAPQTLGKVRMDRDGQVTIIARPRTFFVNPDRRQVEISCSRRDCRYRQTVSLDNLIVTLTQTHIRMDVFDPADPDDSPARVAKQKVNAWSTFSLEPSTGSTSFRGTEDEIQWHLSEYATRRKPEIVANDRGDVRMILP